MQSLRSSGSLSVGRPSQVSVFSSFIACSPRTTFVFRRAQASNRVRHMHGSKSLMMFLAIRRCRFRHKHGSFSVSVVKIWRGFFTLQNSHRGSVPQIKTHWTKQVSRHADVTEEVDVSTQSNRSPTHHNTHTPQQSQPPKLVDHRRQRHLTQHNNPRIVLVLVPFHSSQTGSVPCRQRSGAPPYAAPRGPLSESVSFCRSPGLRAHASAIELDEARRRD